VCPSVAGGLAHAEREGGDPGAVSWADDGGTQVVAPGTPVRARRAAGLAFLGLCLVLASCSSGGHATARGTPTTVAVRPGGAPNETHRVTSSTLAGGVALPTHGHAGSAARETSDSPARAALDQWLQALVGGDTTTVLATSSGPAQALGAVALVVDEALSADGTSTTTTVGSESLSATAVSADEVDFSGNVVLDHTLSGSSGSTKSQDTMAGPIKVLLHSGSWQVENLTYDNQPLVLYTQGASSTVNGVTLVVAFVESLGNATVALVKLTASGPLPVDIEKVTMTLGSGQQVTGAAQFGKGMSVGELDFARIAGAPAQLDVTVKRGQERLPSCCRCRYSNNPLNDLGQEKAA
jgi:hypothetical protein